LLCGSQRDLADLQKDLASVPSVLQGSEGQMGILETFKALKDEIKEEKLRNAHLNEVALGYKRDLMDLDMKFRRLQREMESRLQPTLQNPLKSHTPCNYMNSFSNPLPTCIFYILNRCVAAAAKITGGIQLRSCRYFSAASVVTPTLF
jgi:hypothetical protein